VDALAEVEFPYQTMQFRLKPSFGTRSAGDHKMDIGACLPKCFDGAQHWWWPFLRIKIGGKYNYRVGQELGVFGRLRSRADGNRGVHG
jgi:hypothetical protein